MSSDDWDTCDDAMADKLAITDVAFVSDKKKPPPDYDVVSGLHVCVKKASYPALFVNVSTLVPLR